MYNIAVVGAGVIGLSTAINIQQRLPGCKVRIIADKLDQDTTSWGAGGLFRPTLKHIKGVGVHRLRKWSRAFWEHSASLATSGQAAETGMQIVSGYILFYNKSEPELYEDFVFDHREMTKEEMKNLGFTQYRYGQAVTTIVTTMTKYIPWLINRFREKGGELEQRKVKSMEEFVGKYDLVVNCTGLGSRELVGDKSVFPIRGQIVRVRAPWIKHFLMTEDDTYLIPNGDVLALGGCRQRDNYNLLNSREDTQSILDRCERLVPQLKGAEIDNVWTGLRPTRYPVRVEKETMKFPTGNLKVVHNYGQGANGVSLSWGSALEATDLVVESLAPSSRL